MEKLNLLLNMVIIAYILVKEFGNITKSIKKTSKNIKKYITAVKKQLIIRSIKKEQEKEYDEEFAQRCYAVARGKICFDKHSFMNDIAEDTVVDCNGLSEEDAESPDFLLATCIAVGEDGHEEVIDFDLRGDSAAPLDFSMFGGTRDQHYDIKIVKALAGERRHTASYYAFEQTAYELRKQGKVFDDYVMVTKVTLGQIKAALNNQPIVFDDDVFDEREKDSLIEPDAIIIDVEEETNDKEEATEEEVDFDETLKDGAEKGYEVYTSINVLRQATKMMLKHQENISKDYEEYKSKTKQKDEESFDELDSILTAINNSKYAIKTVLPTSVNELLGGTV